MIGKLTGTLVEKSPPQLVVDCHGVGYEVDVPMSTFYNLPALGEKVTLLTHFVVREDAQLLYGFNTKQERTLFRELLKANGVGPKLALAIMSGMSANQFVACVEREDVSSLVKLPGVGKKTAERLIVEMKDRLKGWTSHDLFTPYTDSAPADNTSVPESTDTVESEAVAALLALGYKPQQASLVVSKVIKPEMSVENVIREALRAML